MSRHKSYLKSEAWRAVKRERLKLTGGGCEECGTRGSLVGHHIHYPRNPYDCTVDDIQMLCHPCHNTLHKGRAQKKSRERKRRDNSAAEFTKLRARLKEPHACGRNSSPWT